MFVKTAGNSSNLSEARSEMLTGKSTTATAAPAAAASSVRSSTPMKPLERHEIEAFYTAVKSLSDALFRERFGSEPHPWSMREANAFSTFLRNRGFFAVALPAHRLPLPTGSEIEGYVRARFASEGILATDEDSTWLADLARYDHGPLNRAGVPFSVLAENQAENTRRATEDRRKHEQRESNRQLANREYQASRAAGLVATDLLRKRFTVWSPTGPSHFQFLATRPGTPLAALGIAVVLGDPGNVEPITGVTQAVVRPAIGSFDNPIEDKGEVVYIPDLG